MRVSFISYSDGGGGAAKAVYNLHKSFKKKSNLIVIDKRQKNKSIIIHQKGIIGKIKRILF